ncbi:tetraprenyl-beta-curcumene synthase [Sulfobacillus thermosulfidooxidans DSM 9293]|uniref:Tetraprenyl-beta-curcumene synthase n=1 Tax=Sulfobacillus thermosulfidooxidans (strain DSM 9293 / VKM B-1269 / AT-1) TaxID=929705 RepID=A0A1W1W9D3_SULTA|nr:tetraprenyl-beta-curcumene synthase family protein [Sulfobacillus thermosulfidooxidans]SMC02749.1 tetraprenyl-beta-curcumene synthase [Sulfobacillus thermosulfidooxidans DSM 9293]
MSGKFLDFIRSWQWGTEYFRVVRPRVVHLIGELHQMAQDIPDPVLREQALSSLQTKQFHCEGGGVFGGPSRDPHGYLLEFLVPYQSLCDYLDTVTDRGPSQDPDNLRELHQGLIDAITPLAPVRDYYRNHPHGEDGGYLASLVHRSQAALRHFPGYPAVQPAITRLVELYVDLQVYKHGPVPTRLDRLTTWFQKEADPENGLFWWEFAAATGSTLGIFALLTLALEKDPDDKQIETLFRLYFPWIGALHILLDYLIDQEEDREGGDLNFVTYYHSPEQATQRLQWIYHHIVREARNFPDAAFHRYVARGLLGFYLSDRKVHHELNRPACQLLATGGSVSIGVWLAAHVGRAP